MDKAITTTKHLNYILSNYAEPAGNTVPGPDTCLAALVMEHYETGHQRSQ